MLILDFVVKNGYCQLVNVAAGGRNTLDVELTDCDLIVSSINCQPPPGQSDHNIIEFIMPLCISSVKDAACHTFYKRYLWRDADYDETNTYLNTVDWSDVICHNPCAEQMWDAFACILWSAIDMFVPFHKVGTNPSTGCRLRPLPLKLRKCMAGKRRIWRQLKSRPNDLQLRGKYRELNCLLVEKIGS